MSAPIIVDSSSNGRNGTLKGSPLPHPAVSPYSGFGNGLVFDGSQNYVDCGTTGFALSGAFTVEARINTSDVTNARSVCGKYGSALADQNYALYCNAGFLVWQVQSAVSGFAQAVKAITTGSHVVAGTWDGLSNAFAYVDGSIGASATLAAVAANGAAAFTIGDTLNGLYWSGTVDEVRVSNIARYSTNYTPASGPFTSDANTLGLWHMEEIWPVPSIQERQAVNRATSF